MQVSTLRPGLMVHVSSSITGNTKYRTTDLGTRLEGGTEESRWETQRTTLDKAEQERATKARSAARSKIQSVCIQSSAFGLSCPESRSDQLDIAMNEAEAIAREFNSTATVTRLGIYITVGRVAEDDERAVRAINNNIRELMDSMAKGVANLDAQAIRDAANKARALGGMLTDSAKERVQVAIDLARSAARKIVTAAETGAAEVDRVTISRLEEARTTFLDMDEQGAIGEVEDSARAIDLEPVREIKAAPVSAPMFDL